jgi:hypothetical protein
METDGTETHGRRGAPDGGAEDLGTDDQEFASVEDTGAAPPENPAVDDV